MLDYDECLFWRAASSHIAMTSWTSFKSSPQTFNFDSNFMHVDCFVDPPGELWAVLSEKDARRDRVAFIIRENLRIYPQYDFSSISSWTALKWQSNQYEKCSFGNIHESTENAANYDEVFMWNCFFLSNVTRGALEERENVINEKTTRRARYAFNEN